MTENGQKDHHAVAHFAFSYLETEKIILKVLAKLRRDLLKRDLLNIVNLKMESLLLSTSQSAELLKKYLQIFLKSKILKRVLEA